MKRRKLLHQEEIATEVRACEAPGCDAEAVHRAPRSRTNLTDSYRFCLDHAREYNASWDFFQGMSQAQIEQYVRDDVTGHRPTWPFGLGKIGVQTINDMLTGNIRDAFGMFGQRAKPAPEQAEVRIPPEKRKAFAQLGLEPGVAVTAIKERYKELVKRYHPDMNGGDRSGEEKLRDVNEAYRTLMRRTA